MNACSCLTALLRRIILPATACVLALMAGGLRAAETERTPLPPGLLDVTQAPYRADPTGRADATKAIQQAINDARDRGQVCFFPGGTYLISDTLSCEQVVRKLDRPRHVDGGTEHYWPVHRPMVLLGSSRGPRPVLKLAAGAPGFDDPGRPKHLVHIWAQTWFDAPGKEEPVWGKEQANISFNHIFRGIDLDIRGHSGAIGIRHSGSQGSWMQDVSIRADGAYAGMNCCPGQGGGTHNVEVLGGRHGIVIEPDSRFPLLNACSFIGQTQAALSYARGGSQVPTLLVGCRIEPAGDTAIDMTTERSHAGVCMVDCSIVLPPHGIVAKTVRDESLFIENTWVRGAATIRPGAPSLPAAGAGGWIRIERFSSPGAQGMSVIDGVLSNATLAVWASSAAPDMEAMARRHRPPSPSFEDAGTVSVRDFGARGDGITDDSSAFAKAVAASDSIFVPPGNYLLSGTLRLKANTRMFGLTRGFTTIGQVHRDSPGAGEPGPSPESDAFVIETVDAAEAAPSLSFITVRGRILWQSGRGDLTLMRASTRLAGHAGGRFYAEMATGHPLIWRGLRQPLAFYALNVERVTSNPQSLIDDCEHVRVYYYKVEAGTIQRANAGDGNTPCAVAHSRDVRLYCLYGNVRDLGDKPMLDVVDSRDVAVAQLKAFQPGSFPHLIEKAGGSRVSLPSTRPCALFIRGP